MPPALRALALRLQLARATDARAPPLRALEPLEADGATTLAPALRLLRARARGDERARAWAACSPRSRRTATTTTVASTAAATRAAARRRGRAEWRWRRPPPRVTFRFAHLRFQDYFAADALCRARRHAPGVALRALLPRFVELVNDGWWHEALKMACECGADAFADELLELAAEQIATERLDDGWHGADEIAAELAKLMAQPERPKGRARLAGPKAMAARRRERTPPTAPLVLDLRARGLRAWPGRRDAVRAAARVAARDVGRAQRQRDRRRRARAARARAARERGVRAPPRARAPRARGRGARSSASCSSSGGSGRPNASGRAPLSLIRLKAEGCRVTLADNRALRLRRSASTSSATTCASSR